MTRVARTTTAPVPMGFRFDPDKNLVENARAAWDVRRQITRPQLENNARLHLRRIFGKDHFNDRDVVFQYDEARCGERPLLEIDDELIAWIFQRGQFALVEFCSDCGNYPRFIGFESSLASFGHALTERDEEAELFVCRRCEAFNSLTSAKGKKK